LFSILYLITPFPDYPVPDNAHPGYDYTGEQSCAEERSGDDKFVVCFILSIPSTHRHIPDLTRFFNLRELQVIRINGSNPIGSVKAGLFLVKAVDFTIYPIIWEISKIILEYPPIRPVKTD
jgi:hypothetical protein